MELLLNGVMPKIIDSVAVIFVLIFIIVGLCQGFVKMFFSTFGTILGLILMAEQKSLQVNSLQQQIILGISTPSKLSLRVV